MGDALALKTVRLATIRRAKSDDAWRKAIKEAHSYGCSLREIAQVADITHPRVHQIVHGES